jgi:hypothetical protein
VKRPVCGRYPVDSGGGAGEVGKLAHHPVQESLVREVARRRDDEAIRPIAVLEEIEKILTLERSYRVVVAAYRQAQRVPGPVVQVEQIVDVVVRRILDLRDLLQDDGALPLDLVRVEAGMQKQIGEHVRRQIGVLGQDAGVVAGVFLARESVQHAADGVDLLGDLCGGAAVGALEQQMLEEVRETALVRAFEARPVLDPDAECHRRHRDEALGNDADTVGKL